MYGTTTPQTHRNNHENHILKPVGLCLSKIPQSSIMHLSNQVAKMSPGGAAAEEEESPEGAAAEEEVSPEGAAAEEEESPEGLQLKKKSHLKELQLKKKRSCSAASHQSHCSCCQVQMMCRCWLLQQDCHRLPPALASHCAD